MITSFNNHRFFATILVLLITSFISVWYAGHEAKEMRDCIIKVADKKTAAISDGAKLYPGLNMSSLCQDGLTELPDDVDVASKFSRSLTSFFTFPAVILNACSSAIPVLYLGSTARFEMFLGLARITRLNAI